MYRAAIAYGIGFMEGVSVFVRVCVWIKLAYMYV